MIFFISGGSAYYFGAGMMYLMSIRETKVSVARIMALP